MNNILRDFELFTSRVLRRLESGSSVYGDRSFDRSPSSLVNEIQDELLDVCGWAFILHERLRLIEAKIARTNED